MRNPVVLMRIANAPEAAIEGLVRRTLRRLRLPLRAKTGIEETAARNRAERLFEVNFRTPWTR